LNKKFAKKIIAKDQKKLKVKHYRR